jgi:hypothetical protein
MANTPPPCNTCQHCGWDCTREEDSSDSAYCKKDLSVGNPTCPEYQRDSCLPELKLSMPVSAYGAPAILPDFYERMESAWRTK